MSSRENVDTAVITFLLCSWRGASLMLIKLGFQINPDSYPASLTLTYQISNRFLAQIKKSVLSSSFDFIKRCYKLINSAVCNGWRMTW